MTKFNYQKISLLKVREQLGQTRNIGSWYQVAKSIDNKCESKHQIVYRHCTLV